MTERLRAMFCDHLSIMRGKYLPASKMRDDESRVAAITAPEGQALGQLLVAVLFPVEAIVEKGAVTFGQPLGEGGCGRLHPAFEQEEAAFVKPMLRCGMIGLRSAGRAGGLESGHQSSGIARDRQQLDPRCRSRGERDSTARNAQLAG